MAAINVTEFILQRYFIPIYTQFKSGSGTKDKLVNWNKIIPVPLEELNIRMKTYKPFWL